jgi:hypothetical protein
VSGDYDDPSLLTEANCRLPYQAVAEEATWPRCARSSRRREVEPAAPAPSLPPWWKRRVACSDALLGATASRATAGSAQPRSSSISSARCRLLSPETVFVSAIRQWASARLARAGPIPGTTSSSSRTRAVCVHGGGSAITRASLSSPAASSRLSRARARRTWLAFSSARSRCSAERPGALGLRCSLGTAPILRAHATEASAAGVHASVTVNLSVFRRHPPDHGVSGRRALGR